MENLYGFTGLGQDSGVRPVIPETLAASQTDVDEITITWDETNMDAEKVQVRHGFVAAIDGTVEIVEGSKVVIGTNTVFLIFKRGDLIQIEAETINKIDEIIDDLHLILLNESETSDDSLTAYIQDPEVLETEEMLPDIESLVVPFEAAVCHFYQLRVVKKFKWSSWDLLSIAFIPAV